MTTPVSPDELATENELICENLIGWQRWLEPGKPLQWKVIAGRGWHIKPTPSFTTWADAGLILAELDERNVDVEIGNGIKNGRGGWYCRLTDMRLNDSPFCNSAPEAIRAAALAYIRSLP